MEGTVLAPAEGTVLAPALEGMKHVKSEEGEMLTKPFLDVCKQILPVIDKFGAAMALVKTDVGGNITVRLFLSLHFDSR
ncbi:putative glycolipid transfer protein [Helianthus anomalus]